MLKKILRVFREDGIYGLLHRALMRIYRARASLGQHLGRKEVWSRYGIRISANPGDATFDHYVTGKYGFYYWNRLRDINTRFIFIDIGANQGLYTICAAMNPNNEKCYSFEPVGETFRLLEKNVDINGVAGKCELLKKAISEQIGQFDIKLISGHSGAATLATGNNPDHSKCRHATIETIDGVAFWEILGRLDIPAYVKIDVEGHELPVIQQLMKSDAADAIKEIYYEVDEKWVAPEEIRAVLEAKGFSRFRKFGNGWHYDVLAER